MIDATKEHVLPTLDTADSALVSKVATSESITEVIEILIEKCTLHPAALLFPRMPRKQFEELKADIKKNGLKEPIFANENLQVFDGRHRLEACRELGLKNIEAWVMDWNEEKITQFSLSANLHRRHLDKTQRALAAARLKESEAGQSLSIASLATKMNVSKRSLDRALVVIKKGSPRLQQDVDSGKITLAAADQLANLPKEEQEGLLKKPRQEIRLRVAEITRVPTSRVPDEQLAPFDLQSRYYDQMEFIEKLCDKLPLPSLIQLVVRLKPRSARIKLLPEASAPERSTEADDTPEPQQ